MSFSHSVSLQVNTPSGMLAYAKSYTSVASYETDVAITTATTNEQHAITLTVANIVSVYLVSDQDLTLKFNSTGSPAPVMLLKANVPYQWTTDSYFTNLLNTNITTLYLTNASGSTANFKARFVYTA